MRKNLRQAIEAMETTRVQTDPVRELRQWRLAASKRFVALALQAKPAPQKGRRR